MLLEFEGAHQEVSAGEGVPKEELPKCPDHRPSSFLKGKPWCMVTQLIYIYIYIYISLSTFTYLLH
jgi:hypothetical protein